MSETKQKLSETPKKPSSKMSHHTVVHESSKEVVKPSTGARKQSQPLKYDLSSDKKSQASVARSRKSRQSVKSKSSKRVPSQKSVSKQSTLQKKDIVEKLDFEAEQVETPTKEEPKQKPRKDSLFKHSDSKKEIKEIKEEVKAAVKPQNIQSRADIKTELPSKIVMTKEEKEKDEIRKQAFATLHEMMSQKYTTLMKDPVLAQFPSLT